MARGSISPLLLLIAAGGVGCPGYPGFEGERCNDNDVCLPGLACFEGSCRAPFSDASTPDVPAVREDAAIDEDTGADEDAGVDEDAEVGEDGELRPVCGDGTCEGGETASCASDCAWTELTTARWTTCGLRRDGTAWCWGKNELGQVGLGTGTSTIPVARPRRVAVNEKMIAIATGENTCAIDQSQGRVWCWGLGALGELGTGDPNFRGETCLDGALGNRCRSTPDLVIRITGASALGSNGSHVCTLISGTVQCWGHNFSGELGRGTTGGFSATPEPVLDLTTATKLAVGVNHTCAIIAGGDVYCWGSNSHGQIGDSIPQGGTNKSGTPIRAGTSTAAVDLAAGQRTTCVLHGDRTVHCWGSNEWRIFGDPALGATFSSGTPRQVPGLTDIVALSTGWHHICALSGTGAVKCWGENASGQLCDGTTIAPRDTPQPAGFSMTASIAAGGHDHTCVITAGGRAECCGRGDSGQLGDDRAQSSTIAVEVLD